MRLDDARPAGTAPTTTSSGPTSRRTPTMGGSRRANDPAGLELSRRLELVLSAQTHHPLTYPATILSRTRPVSRTRNSCHPAGHTTRFVYMLSTHYHRQPSLQACNYPPVPTTARPRPRLLSTRSSQARSPTTPPRTDHKPIQHDLYQPPHQDPHLPQPVDLTVRKAGLGGLPRDVGGREAHTGSQIAIRNREGATSEGSRNS